MNEAELKVLGFVISTTGSISAVIYGIWRILKIFKDSILKEMQNNNLALVHSIEKSELKTEMAVNKAVQPIIARVDSLEEKVKDHDKKINGLQKVQSENTAIAIEYKTLKRNNKE